MNYDKRRERELPRLGYRCAVEKKHRFRIKAQTDGLTATEAINTLMDAYLDGDIELVTTTQGPTPTVPGFMAPPQERQQ